MFSVKWLKSGKEAEMGDVENSTLTDLDNIVSFYRGRLYSKRLGNLDDQPDGFVVVDDTGDEVRRWFETPSSAA
jgi:hypothetical protein